MYLFLLCILHLVKCFKPENHSLLVKVVGGFDCHPRIVPYLASLQDRNHRIFCGGSILHSYWAMTAAHCCKATEYTDYMIYTGLVEDFSKWDAGVQSVRIKRMIPHTKFTKSPWSSDICLVELAEPVKQNEHVKFVRIPTPFVHQQLMKRKICNMSLAMGFGYRGVIFENGTSIPGENPENRMLQCVFQRIMSDEYCKEGPIVVDFSTTLCTHGTPIVASDTCAVCSKIITRIQIDGQLRVKLVQGNTTGKIVHGFTCHPRDYPYLASIKVINSRLFCGGTIINKYWILTAGHCCTYTRKEQLIAYTGLTEARAYIQRSTVKRRLIHPDFTMLPLSSDICLLKVYKPIRENPHTTYVKLADQLAYARVSSSRLCNSSIVIGFGKQNIVYQNQTEQHLPYNRKLQCVYQRLMPHEFCSWNTMIDQTMLCTLGTPQESADVCRGDSGGPLICQGLQIGIVSAGRGCGIGLPSYFTRVDKFYDYILMHSSGIISDLTIFIFIDVACTFLYAKINYIYL